MLTGVLFVRDWEPLAQQAADQGQSLRIAVHDTLFAKIQGHGRGDTTNEVAGFLLGITGRLPGRSQLVVEVRQVLPAKHTISTPSSVEFSHDTWVALHKERERLSGNLEVVGWYHTHPTFGLFLSEYDTFIHKSFFAKSYHVALVIDPLRNLSGFFGWIDGRVEARKYSGFWEISRSKQPLIKPGDNLAVTQTMYY